MNSKQDRCASGTSFTPLPLEQADFSRLLAQVMPQQHLGFLSTPYFIPLQHQAAQPVNLVRPIPSRMSTCVGQASKPTLQGTHEAQSNAGLSTTDFVLVSKSRLTSVISQLVALLSELQEAEARQSHHCAPQSAVGERATHLQANCETVASSHNVADTQDAQRQPIQSEQLLLELGRLAQSPLQNYQTQNAPLSKYQQLGRPEPKVSNSTSIVSPHHNQSFGGVVFVPQASKTQKEQLSRDSLLANNGVLKDPQRRLSNENEQLCSSSIPQSGSGDPHDLRDDLDEIKQLSPNELIDQLTQRGRPHTQFFYPPMPVIDAQNAQSKIKPERIFALSQNRRKNQGKSCPVGHILQNDKKSKKQRRQPLVQKPRIRLNKAQKARLEAHYQVDPNWSNELIQEMALQLGVTFTKIYKWNWERKKKDRLHNYNMMMEDGTLMSIFPEVRVCNSDVDADRKSHEDSDGTVSELKE